MSEKSLKKRKEMVRKFDDMIKDYNDSRKTGKTTVILCFSEGNVASCSISHESTFLK